MILREDLSQFIKQNNILLNPTYESMLDKGVIRVTQFREYEESSLLETFKMVCNHWFPRHMILAVDKDGGIHNSPKGVSIDYLIQPKYYGIYKNYKYFTGTVYFIRVIN